MENIAAILRGILGPSVQGLPDIALVGGAGGAIVLVLIILFALIGAMAGGKKKKQKREEDYVAPARAAAPAPVPQRAPEPPPQRAPQPAPQRAAQPASQRAPDPVEKFQRDAESGVARARQDTERLVEVLTAERDRVVNADCPFAAETPTRGFLLLAEKLIASDAPRSAPRGARSPRAILAAPALICAATPMRWLAATARGAMRLCSKVSIAWTKRSTRWRTRARGREGFRHPRHAAPAA